MSMFEDLVFRVRSVDEFVTEVEPGVLGCGELTADGSIPVKAALSRVFANCA
jgi:hypothetical protein